MNISYAILEIMENTTCLKSIYENYMILSSIFTVITTNKNSQNITHAIGILINLLKLISIENLKMPYLSLSIENDTVTTSTSIDKDSFKNEIIGELILENIEGILKHFDIEKDIPKQNKLENSVLTSSVPLGVKR